MDHTDAAGTDIRPEVPTHIEPALDFEPRGNWEGSLHLLNQLEFTSLPKHIAIIMDGNRRWARDRDMHVLEGHRAGVKKAREIGDLALDINSAAGFKAIELLTFFAFSKENWNRSVMEVSGLMEIFEQAAIREIYPLHERDIRVRIIGDKDDLPESLVKRISDIENLTKDNSSLEMNFCLSYSGRSDILNGIKRIHELYMQGKIDIESIDEDFFGAVLDTSGIPDPDLLIRTSGEMRFSNFLLWQVAYTELWVSKVYWPDFNYKHFVRAIMDFHRRERRYGGG
jgi:undecaprenyl diphosphate synthase